MALTYTSAAMKAQAVADKIEAEGGRALVIRADNGNPDEAVGAVEQTVRVLGGIDILVNNAGIFTGGPLDQIT
ncbi:SDR family NAD(P)-dependent oxidoreductase [Micromonospora chersina]|uniref:SDR family NAD(P)-dependent oxidoreductase n=1 Tax=Micromonospora chersina TaxID=47854 RepID=UPI00372248D8